MAVIPMSLAAPAGVGRRRSSRLQATDAASRPVPRGGAVSERAEAEERTEAADFEELAARAPRIYTIS